jgi:hypothetical protein
MTPQKKVQFYESLERSLKPRVNDSGMQKAIEIGDYKLLQLQFELALDLISNSRFQCKRPACDSDLDGHPDQWLREQKDYWPRERDKVQCVIRLINAAWGMRLFEIPYRSVVARNSLIDLGQGRVFPSFIDAIRTMLHEYFVLLVHDPIKWKEMQATEYSSWFLTSKDAWEGLMQFDFSKLRSGLIQEVARLSDAGIAAPVRDINGRANESPIRSPACDQTFVANEEAFTNECAPGITRHPEVAPGIKELNEIVSGGMAGTMQAALRLPAVHRVSQVMMNMLESREEHYLWTLDDWVEHLKSSRKTIIKTEAWKRINARKEARKRGKIQPKVSKETEEDFYDQYS